MRVNRCPHSFRKLTSTLHLSLSWQTLSHPSETNFFLWIARLTKLVLSWRLHSDLAEKVRIRKQRRDFIHLSRATTRSLVLPCLGQVAPSIPVRYKMTNMLCSPPLIHSKNVKRFGL